VSATGLRTRFSIPNPTTRASSPTLIIFHSSALSPGRIDAAGREAGGVVIGCGAVFEPLATTAAQLFEATQVHHVARRSGGVALRHARAAAGADAADRCADGIRRERPGRTGPCRGVPRGTPEARWTESRNIRIDTRWAGRRGVDATVREGNRRATARPHSFRPLRWLQTNSSGWCS
jgi:hypothetical protein